MSFLISVVPDELKVLKVVRRKKKITCRDMPYWDCENLVKKSLLNKYFPKKGRSPGWPHYILSARGRRVLRQHELSRNNNNNR